MMAGNDTTLSENITNLRSPLDKNVPVVDDLDTATTDWYLQGQFWLLSAILFILVVSAVYVIIAKSRRRKESLDQS